MTRARGPGLCLVLVPALLAAVLFAAPASGVQRAATCVVPNVHKLPVVKAENRILAAGCKLGRITNQPSQTVKSGRVISQSPHAGARVAKSRRVKLFVSTGKPSNTTPPATPCVMCGPVTYS